MRPIACMGDMAGGPIVGPCHYNILANGRPVAAAGAMTAPHPHGIYIFPGFLIPTTPMVTFNGTPSQKVGDPTTCGHPIVTGSYTTLAT